MSNDTTSPQLLARRFGRRAVMRGGLLSGAGLAAAAVIGCGSSSDDETRGELTLDVAHIGGWIWAAVSWPVRRLLRLVRHG